MTRSQSFAKKMEKLYSETVKIAEEVNAELKMSFEEFSAAVDRNGSQKCRIIVACCAAGHTRGTKGSISRYQFLRSIREHLKRNVDSGEDSLACPQCDIEQTQIRRIAEENGHTIKKIVSQRHVEFECGTCGSIGVVIMDSFRTGSRRCKVCRKWLPYAEAKKRVEQLNYDLITLDLDYTGATHVTVKCRLCDKKKIVSIASLTPCGYCRQLS